MATVKADLSIPGPEHAARIARRRVSVVTFVVFTASTATLLMADLLWGMPLRGWNGVVLALYAILISLVAFGASQAFFGFLVRRGRGDRYLLTRLEPDDEANNIPLAPTAVVLPIYNEDVARVYAGLRAIYQSVAATGQLEHFDFFILSDTTDPNLWIEEEVGWVELNRELNARGRIHYRKRRHNTNAKAGNIADFCRRWGARYRYMLVLDADSIMSGPTLVRLVRMLERHAGVALIQTAPVLARAETLFARILQFGMRLYSPVFLSGLNYWQQGQGNFWGHNAIVRLAPFIAHCALPELPGSAPFGGKILSHDFVEAALLQRAGWAVWMIPDVDGSYEEGPPTLIDSAQRDRRWCQGNLQHFWLLFARGLRGASRIHMALGILSYAASVLWLASLVVGTLLVIGFERTGLTWVPTPGFAITFGIGAQVEIIVLVALTVLLLFGPKLLAVIDLLLQPGGAARFGGISRVLLGVLGENLFSLLLAPILMVFHAKFVIATVLGAGVRWVAQRRSSGAGTEWGVALRTHAYQTILGLVWLGAQAYYAPGLLVWMAPVLAGLVLSAPFSVLTSRESYGRAARRHGLFCIPEEIAPPSELVGVADALARPAPFAPARPDTSPDRGLFRAVFDPYVNAVHVCLLRERPGHSEEIRQYFDEVRERLLREGPQVLTVKEKLALLSDAYSMGWLHAELWRRPPANLAAWWREALVSHTDRVLVSRQRRRGMGAQTFPEMKEQLSSR